MLETTPQNSSAEGLAKDHRSYHETSSPYPLPNDATEHARLDEQNAAYLALMNDQLLHVPFSPSSSSTPSRILDVGCGTGATTLQLAAAFPSASATGLDLSPVPALQNGGAPSNVRAVQGNFLDPTTPVARGHGGPGKEAAEGLIERDSFDLVFSRLLVMGVDDWDGFYARVRDVLRPGGGAWVETQDLDQVWYAPSTSPCDDGGGDCGRRISDGWPWLAALRSASTRRGMDLECASKAAARMRRAGLVDVRTERFVLPLGEWAAHPEADAAARFARRTLRACLQGLLVRMLREDGVDEARIERLREDVLPDELWGKGVHRVLTVTCGRRP